MAFKNALKMLIGKFRLLWVILLYILITAAIVSCLGMPFVLPVYRAFRNANVGKALSDFFGSIGNGANFNEWLDSLVHLRNVVRDSLRDNIAAKISSGMLLGFVFVFAFRFVFGLYEIPLTYVLEGAMSSNARIGFTGRYVGKLGKSCKFVLIKMLYTVLFDVFISAVFVLLTSVLPVRKLKYFIFFLFMVILLALLALRYAFIAMWAPAVVLEEKGIFRSFAFSIKNAFLHMGSLFSTYLVAWTLIIALNMLVGVFTFGAGLILTVPMSVLFIKLLDMTVYYGKNGKRYYIDAATVVTPAVAEETPTAEK